MKRGTARVVDDGAGGVMRVRSILVVMVLLLTASGCVHQTKVTSDREGAQVFVGDETEPVGETPAFVPATSKPVHVKHGDERVTFHMETQVEPIATCTNTLLATVVAAGVIGATGAGIYALGLVLSWAAPAIGPIVALFGGPPAFVGTAFWMVVGGALCGAVTLPLAACGSGQKGPDTVHVSFDDGKARSTPDGSVREAPQRVDEQEQDQASEASITAMRF
jgi:hypothetical protein